MPTRRLVLSAILPSALAAGGLRPAFADDYPAKPIRVIIPYPPGNSIELLVRAIGLRTATEGVNFYVDNKPGGNTVIGMSQAANAQPDGYTVAGTTVGIDVLNPLNPNLGYDPSKLTPLSLIGFTPYIFIVRKDFPANTIGELVAMAKEKPGTLNFGSSGTGLTLHVVARKFTQEAGIRMTHIPFSGTAPGYQALIRGDIQMYPDIVMSAFPHIKAGTFKALAIAAEQRHPLLPDVPTMAESGFNNFVMSVWYGLNVPSKTPPEAMNRLVKAIDKALTDPTLIAEFANRGLVLYPPGGPQLMKTQIEADKKRWEPVIRSLNLKGDE